MTNDHKSKRPEDGYVRITVTVEQLQRPVVSEWLHVEAQAFPYDHAATLAAVPEQEHIERGVTAVPEPELLPCPFCGEAPTLSESDDKYGTFWYAVRCENKSCLTKPQTGSFMHVRASAVIAWNRRAPNQRIVQLEEALKLQLAERAAGWSAQVSARELEIGRLREVLEGAAKVARDLCLHRRGSEGYAAGYADGTESAARWIVGDALFEELLGAAKDRSDYEGLKARQQEIVERILASTAAEVQP